MGTVNGLGFESGVETSDMDVRAELRGIDSVRRSDECAVAVRPTGPRFDADKGGRVYLFIYRVRHAYDAYAWVDNVRYCTVFALGKAFKDAERIAINCVHQHGWRILRTDTATEFDVARFSDGGTDAAHVANLRDFGVSFKLNR